MNLPSGLVFYLDFKYGSGNHLSQTPGTSLFGGTNSAKFGSTDAAVNGLYGQGRYGYSERVVTSSAFQSGNCTVASASWADLQFASEFSSSLRSGNVKGIYKIGLDVNDNTQTNTGAASGYVWNVDLNAVRSFGLQTTGDVAYTVLNTYANVVNTGTIASPNYIINLYVSQSSTATTPARTPKLNYTLQPTDNLRGDFEAGKTAGEGSGNSAATATQNIDTDINIPEVNLVLNSEPIVAKTRKLKAVWTPELAQDLNAYHSIDAEAELTALLSEYVSMEIDLEILDMLNESVTGTTTEAWSAQIGTEFQKTLSFAGGTTGTPVANFTRVVNSSPNRTAYVKSTWFQTLGNKIQKVSNKIHQLTLRGGANFLVCSPDVATILESIPGYVVNTDGDSAKFAMGVARVGSFASRFQVYKNPYMTDNVILVGFRGSNFLETGAVYAPYIPLIQTPLVYDPTNFTPRRGVMTRYAKKVVRPEFYGKVIISDLDTV
jgi:hypothetical protein